MPVRLADLYPLLAQAYRDNYVWLRDFEDDQILVNRDLYEVVRALLELPPIRLRSSRPSGTLARFGWTGLNHSQEIDLVNGVARF